MSKVNYEYEEQLRDLHKKQEDVMQQEKKGRQKCATASQAGCDQDHAPTSIDISDSSENEEEKKESYDSGGEPTEGQISQCSVTSRQAGSVNIVKSKAYNDNNEQQTSLSRARKRLVKTDEPVPNKNQTVTDESAEESGQGIVKKGKPEPDKTSSEKQKISRQGLINEDIESGSANTRLLPADAAEQSTISGTSQIGKMSARTRRLGLSRRRGVQTKQNESPESITDTHSKSPESVTDTHYKSPQSVTDTPSKSSSKMTEREAESPVLCKKTKLNVQCSPGGVKKTLTMQDASEIKKNTLHEDSEVLDLTQDDIVEDAPTNVEKNSFNDTKKQTQISAPKTKPNKKGQSSDESREETDDMETDVSKVLESDDESNDSIIFSKKTDVSAVVSDIKKAIKASREDGVVGMDAEETVDPAASCDTAMEETQDPSADISSSPDLFASQPINFKVCTSCNDFP